MNGRLPVIDALELDRELRQLLLPEDAFPGAPPLPRYFYQVDSWEQAKSHKLTAHFTLAELMTVDCREAPRLLREFPHYVPCTISVLARYLEEFRARVEAPVFISANGGYRSPSHQLSTRPTAHLWGTAANIYRVGNTFLDTESAIERYTKIAESIGQELSIKPYGHGPGETDDHLHLDLGFLSYGGYNLAIPVAQEG